MVSTLVVVAVALLIVYVSRKLFKQHKLNLPPGPTPLPIIGCLHLLGTHPQKNFADLALKYGPLMSIRLGQRYYVVATSREAAKEFLKVQLLLSTSHPSRENHEPWRQSFQRPHTCDSTSEENPRERAYICKAAGSVQVYPNRGACLHAPNNLQSEGTHPDQDDSEILEFIEIVEETNSCGGAIHLQDVFNFIPEGFDSQGLDTRFRKIKARLDAFHRNVVNQHKEERRKNPVLQDEKILLDVLLDQLENLEYEVTNEHVL